MAKTFRYQDNLGNILSRSPEPFMKPLKEPLFEGFDDYLKSVIADYSVYAETSPDNASKYTMISNAIYSNLDSGKKETQKEMDKDHNETPSPIVKDVIASKMFEQSKMSTINTVYIGSLTIIGLYVLFKYMKP